MESYVSVDAFCLTKDLYILVVNGSCVKQARQLSLEEGAMVSRLQHLL
jgi:hypothetical protein